MTPTPLILSDLGDHFCSFKPLLFHLWNIACIFFTNESESTCAWLVISTVLSKLKHL